MQLRHLVIAITLSLTVTSTALADDKRQAEALLRAGAALYQSGDRVGAVAKFEAAYKLYKAPVILYNLGKAYRGVGRNAIAHRTLSKALADPQLRPGLRTEVSTMLTGLESIVGLLDITAPPGTNVLVDGDPVGDGPLRASIAVGAGVHLVELRHDGKIVASKQLAVGIGRRATVELALPTPPPPDKRPVAKPHSPPTKPPPKLPTPKQAAKTVEPPPKPIVKESARREPHSTPVYKKWWFWTGIGAAVAATAAIVVATSGQGNDVDPSLGSFDFDSF